MSCSQPRITVNNINDVESLNFCPTISGSIVLGSSFRGPLLLDSINTIEGSLLCYGVAELISVAANELVTIGQTLELYNLVAFTTISLPAARSIYNISAVNVPSFYHYELQVSVNVSFFEPSESNCRELVILGGFNATDLSVTVTNNSRMTFFALPNVTNVPTFTIAGNDRNLAVSMPALQEARDVTIWNVSSLNMGNLTNITRSLQLAYNSFPIISFPSLASVQGSFFIDGNSELQDLELPLLEDTYGTF